MTPDDPPPDADSPPAVTADAPAVGSGDGPGGAARRRRLAEVFGDVLPDSTRADSDESTADPGLERTSQRSRDAEMLRDVPPHHG